MKYISYIIAQNGGRDITHLGDFISEEEALRELKETIKENYGVGSNLKKCILYEIQKVYDVDLKKMYQAINDEEKLRKQQEEEKKERELYEKLKQKFENKI